MSRLICEFVISLIKVGGCEPQREARLSINASSPISLRSIASQHSCVVTAKSERIFELASSLLLATCRATSVDKDHTV
jgi:hypothetical protein